MAGQIPNLSQAASRFQQQAGQVAQAVKQQAINEVKAAANSATEQAIGDEFLEFENEEPQEELRQGQIPSAEYDNYIAEVKQKEQQALNALHARIEQMRGQRIQMEQAYHQRVNEQMQAKTIQNQASVESVAPQSARPAPIKNPEMAKKKH